MREHWRASQTEPSQAPYLSLVRAVTHALVQRRDTERRGRSESGHLACALRSFSTHGYVLRYTSMSSLEMRSFGMRRIKQKTHTHTHTRIHIHIHTHTHTDTNTQTQTHTRNFCLKDGSVNIIMLQIAFEVYFTQ
jgi:hypothetical protein